MHRQSAAPSSGSDSLSPKTLKIISNKIEEFHQSQKFPNKDDLINQLNHLQAQRQICVKGVHGLRETDQAIAQL